MSATGTEDNERPLLLTSSSHYGTLSSSAADPLAKNLKSLKIRGFAQVVFGLLSLNFGLILSLSLALWQDANIKFPHWPEGLLFTGFGVVSMLAGKYPRPGLVLLSVLLNLAALVFAVAIVVFHVTNLLRTDFWTCDCSPDCATEPPYTSTLMENCELGKRMYVMVYTWISNMLMALSGAQFGCSIRVIITGIRVWRSFRTNRNQSPEAPRPRAERHTPVSPALTNVTIISADNPLVLFGLPKKDHGENGKDLKANAS